MNYEIDYDKLQNRFPVLALGLPNHLKQQLKQLVSTHYKPNIRMF